MSIPVGEEVVILDSGIIGVIQYYDGNTAYILANGELHQAHKKDIARTNAFGVINKPDADKKQSHENTLPQQRGVIIRWKAPESPSGSWPHFEVSIGNYTETELLCQYQLWLNEEVHTTFRKSLAKGAEAFLHLFKPDQINDRPVWTIQCWKKDAQGVTIQVADQEMKLRAKQYVARIQSPEFLNTRQLLFEVPVTDASLLQKPVAEKPALPQFDFNQKKKVEQHHEVLQKAHMPDFIDLHAEKLLPDHRHLSATEILTMQVHSFKNYLEKAIRLRMHKVYIVHGHGKGVLKQEIEKALKKYPEVSSYNNDYNPRFGFGATEIILDP